MSENPIEIATKAAKPCSLDPSLFCRLEGGCPVIINIEILPLTEENKIAWASWCEHRNDDEDNDSS